MTHRIAPVALLLSLASCITPPPVPSATPSSSSGATSGACGDFKIRSSADLDRCKTKCRDDERDQMKSCSGPGCQGGSATAGCVTKCDDGQKAAQQAKCYQN